jgi:hypothetical protein
VRFDTKPHRFYCGIDLHARTMYVCILDRDGEIVVHRQMQANPDALLKVVAPDREDIVVAVEWTLHVVLARGPLCPSGESLRPRPCPVPESPARRSGQARQDRCPHDCGAAPRGDAPHMRQDKL